jgi:hypothetical protein
LLGACFLMIVLSVDRPRFSMKEKILHILFRWCGRVRGLINAVKINSSRFRVLGSRIA